MSSRKTTAHSGQLLEAVNETFLLKATEDHLCQRIEQAVHDYTEAKGGSTVLTDEQYDQLVDTVRKRFPHRSEWLESIQVCKDNNVEEPPPTIHCPMVSLNKAHTNDDLMAFLKRGQSHSSNVRSRLSIQPKLDGQSVQLVYESSTKVHLYTRMKPRGRDISYLLEFLMTQILKVKIPTYSVSLRGELILPKDKFEHARKTFEPEAVNARTMLTGAVNGSIAHHQKGETWTDKERYLFENMVLVLYAVLHPAELEYGRQTELLRQWVETGVEPLSRVRVVPEVIHPMDFLSSDRVQDRLVEHLHKLRTSLPFLLDGLVLKWVDVKEVLEQAVDGEWRSPKYSIAFKVYEQGVDGTVDLIEWNLTRHNMLFPRVKLLNPISVGNVTVTWVTGVNASFVYHNKIMPGAVLEIIHSGDTIPRIMKVKRVPEDGDVLKHSFPPHGTWVWDENEVHISRVISSNPDQINPDQLVEQLTFICKLFDLKDLGGKTLQSLVNQQVIKRMRHLFELRDNQQDKTRLQAVDSIGIKKACNIIERIREVRSGMTNWNQLTHTERIMYLSKLMVGSAVFGRGFGVKQAVSVLTKAHELSVPPPWTSDWLKTNVEMFGAQRSEQLSAHWTDFVHWLKHEFVWIGVEQDLSVLWNGSDGSTSSSGDNNGVVSSSSSSSSSSSVNPTSATVLPNPVLVVLTLSGLRDKNGERTNVWMNALRDNNVYHVQIVTQDTITTKTNAVVVVNDEGMGSTKARKAEEKGIPVLTVDQVVKWLSTL